MPDDQNDVEADEDENEADRRAEREKEERRPILRLPQIPGHGMTSNSDEEDM